jgi:hypothetical protein
MRLRPYYWFSEFQQHESRRRRWPKKIKPWEGPVKQAYIHSVGDTDVLDITNQADQYRISSLNLSDVIGVATQGSNGTWTGEHGHPAYPASAVYLSGPYADLAIVEAEIRQSYVDHIVEETRIQASPTLQLERVLKNRDWTSHFSDDYSVWAAGEVNDRALKEILPQVPADDVKRLWQQYAPNNVSCPVW